MRPVIVYRACAFSLFLFAIVGVMVVVGVGVRGFCSFWGCCCRLGLTNRPRFFFVLGSWPRLFFSFFRVRRVYVTFFFFLQSLFPLEKGPEEETDEDEDTAANSAQLAEWDGVAPALGDGGYDGFDSFNDSDEEDRHDAAVVGEERKEEKKGGGGKGAASKAAFAR